MCCLLGMAWVRLQPAWRLSIVPDRTGPSVSDTLTSSALRLCRRLKGDCGTNRSHCGFVQLYACNDGSRFRETEKNLQIDAEPASTADRRAARSHSHTRSGARPSSAAPALPMHPASVRSPLGGIGAGGASSGRLFLDPSSIDVADESAADDASLRDSLTPPSPPKQQQQQQAFVSDRAAAGLAGRSSSSSGRHAAQSNGGVGGSRRRAQSSGRHASSSYGPVVDAGYEAFPRSHIQQQQQPQHHQSHHYAASQGMHSHMAPMASSGLHEMELLQRLDHVRASVEHYRASSELQARVVDTKVRGQLQTLVSKLNTQLRELEDRLNGHYSTSHNMSLQHTLEFRKKIKKGQNPSLAVAAQSRAALCFIRMLCSLIVPRTCSHAVVCFLFFVLVCRSP